MSDLIKSKFVTAMRMNGELLKLEVRKYDRKVFYGNLWDENPECIKARGAVFIDGKQVVFPMDKCFNYGENGAGLNLPKHTQIVAYKKLNGFMANLTWVDNVGWIVSTTGDAMVVLPFESSYTNKNEFLNMAATYMNSDGFNAYLKLIQELCKKVAVKSLTLTFEVCHPDDPHIVVEEFGLHPICYQLNGETIPLEVQGESFEGTIQEILDLVKSVEHEGFMVYDLEGDLLFKLKSPYYLAKKWVQRGGSKRVWSQAYKERLDEEYYPIVEHLRTLYTENDWDSLSEEFKSEAFLNTMESLRGHHD